MKPIRLIIIVLLIVAIAVVYSRFSQNKTSNTPEDNSEAVASISATPAVGDEGWKKVSFSNLGFSLSLPSDLKPINKNDGSIEIYQAGIGQKDNTNIVDGLKINITQKQLPDAKSLSDQVDSDIALKKKALGKSFEINDSIGTAVVGEVEGVIYQALEASVSSTYVYLPQSNNKYLFITDNSMDSEGYTFQILAALVLQTITIP